MLEYIVDGGSELYGNITVSGSKNAALPVLFAALTVKGVSEITNLPDIGDVNVAIDILRSFGAYVQRCGSRLKISAEGAKYNDGSRFLASKLRASTYLLGSCLAAFGRADLMNYGGCSFSLRPIDIHLDACKAFGAEREGDMLLSKGLSGCEFTVRKSSVGATVNTIIMAANAKGNSIIRGIAAEPHIDTLIKFLVSAGAEIRREGDTLFVTGRELHSGRVRIPADMIEAGSFLSAGALCGGKVKVVGASARELESFLFALGASGCTVTVGDGYIAAEGRPKRSISVITGPFPSFPTDLQPIIAPLLAAGQGGEITDTVWKERFGYLEELKKQGVRFEREDNRACIFPSELKSAAVSAGDLRGGASSLLAALCAKGQSVIKNAEIINRGYDDLVGKLNRLGASVRVKKS